MRVCSLRYPARNADEPYRHLWPVKHTITFHILINGTILEKTLLNTKSVFWISVQILSETFLFLRRTERDMIKMNIGLRVKFPLFLSDFSEAWIFSTYFLKILKFHENPSSGSRDVPCRRMDGEKDRETTKPTVAFRNFANAHKNWPQQDQKTATAIRRRDSTGINSPVPWWHFPGRCPVLNRILAVILKSNSTARCMDDDLHALAKVA